MKLHSEFVSGCSFFVAENREKGEMAKNREKGKMAENREKGKMAEKPGEGGDRFSRIAG